MNAAELDRKARIGRKETALRTQLVELGANPAAVARLRLEGLFELRWRMLNQLMGAPGPG